MSSPVSSFRIYNTMLIENQCGGIGTGFLVSKANAPGTNEGRVFLLQINIFYMISRNCEIVLIM